MRVVAKTLGVARSNLIKQTQPQPSRSRGRPPLPETAVVEEIKAVIATMPPMAIGGGMPLWRAERMSRARLRPTISGLTG
jgi:hypothetical protein